VASAPSASLSRHRVPVLDSHISWLEAGQGAPVLLLHGNPTSALLWRNIIPFLAPLGRCIAPDLIGFGQSGRFAEGGDRAYGFGVQRDYLDAFIDTLALDQPLTLVLHDWGSVLGFDWANRHRERVRAIAYMEAVVRPVAEADLEPQTVEMFRVLRSAAGEQLILQENMYIEQALPATVLRPLTAAELDVHRGAFPEPGESRRAMLDLCREVPFDGTPAEVWAAEQAYADWLARSAVPKLFVNAEPGAFLVGDKRRFCRSWPNQEEVTVPGLHFVQEDAPEDIGAALAQWYARLPATP